MNTWEKSRTAKQFLVDFSNSEDEGIVLPDNVSFHSVTAALKRLRDSGKTVNVAIVNRHDRVFLVKTDLES